VVQCVRRRALHLGGYPDEGLVILRTVRACGDTFPAILMALEDGLAELVAFDGNWRWGLPSRWLASACDILGIWLSLTKIAFRPARSIALATVVQVIAFPAK
jgi:hypothetical protein